MPRVEGLQDAKNRQDNSGNRRKRKWCLLSRAASLHRSSASSRRPLVSVSAFTALLDERADDSPTRIRQRNRAGIRASRRDD